MENSLQKKAVEHLLNKYANGNISAAEAFSSLKNIFPSDYCDTNSEINIDYSRKNRIGIDEVVYGKHKSLEQIASIAEIYKEKGLTFLCTGLNKEKIAGLKSLFPEFEYIENAGIMRSQPPLDISYSGSVAIITAGTSDSFVAYEAAETLRSIGVRFELFFDVGVAGVHRFFSIKNDIEKHDVIIVIAGMEGALPSLAGGIFSQPVIAVPTSVGYGTALNGFTPLFAMLTSCANGISVMNIDNGFGAAMAAFRIIRLVNREFLT